LTVSVPGAPEPEVAAADDDAPVDDEAGAALDGAAELADEVTAAALVAADVVLVFEPFDDVHAASVPSATATTAAARSPLPRN
jgi:hypothetical protein